MGVNYTTRRRRVQHERTTYDSDAKRRMHEYIASTDNANVHESRCVPSDAATADLIYCQTAPARLVLQSDRRGDNLVAEVSQSSPVTSGWRRRRRHRRATRRPLGQKEAPRRDARMYRKRPRRSRRETSLYWPQSRQQRRAIVNTHCCGVLLRTMLLYYDLTTAPPPTPPQYIISSMSQHMT